MTGAHCVDVHMLHEHNIEFHLGTGDILACKWAVLMTVYPFDGDWHPVHTQLSGGENGIA